MEKIESISKKEKELPPLEVKFFYSIHETADDLKGLEKFFKEADIYIPEGAGWSQKALNGFRNVSEGLISPKNFIDKMYFERNPSYGFLLGLLKLIYKSHKPIIFVDISSESHIFDKLRENSDFQIDFNQSFEDVLKSFRTFIEKYDTAQKKREEFIVSNFRGKLKEFIKNYPELKNKNKLKVLFTLGTLHTTIFHEFKSSNAETSRGFNSMPFIFGFQEEGIRRHRFNKEIEDEFMAKILLEKMFDSIIMPILKSIFKDNAKAYSFQRKIVSRFNFGEIKEFFNQIKSQKTRAELFKFINGLFRRKNIKLPSPE